MLHQHVTSVFKDQKFRMFHDNRRQIIEPDNFKGCDLSDTVLDSKPFLNRIQENKQRFISKFPFTIDCNKQ